MSIILSHFFTTCTLDNTNETNKKTCMKGVKYGNQQIKSEYLPTPIREHDQTKHNLRTSRNNQIATCEHHRSQWQEISENQDLPRRFQERSREVSLNKTNITTKTHRFDRKLIDIMSIILAFFLSHYYFLYI